VIGLAWGTSVSATVDAFQVDGPLPLKIVQLLGALDARNHEYDGHGLVSRLVDRTGGEGFYLNEPFICPNPEMVRTLRQTQGIRETVSMAQRVQVLLAGVGSTLPEHCSFYLAGYMPLEGLMQLRQQGAVGDVCGLHFTVEGQPCCDELRERLVTIQPEELLNIPVRIGVAGGAGKVDAILGALRSGYINELVTDTVTARRVLELAGQRVTGGQE
jgi:DNA-binding transcriptional regulator LsrR (DeoR family)